MPYVSNIVARERVLGVDDLTRCTHNVVKLVGITCRVCGEPTAGTEHCRHCAQHRKIPHPADVVAPLMYAVAGTPAATLLRDYKDHPLRTRRTQGARVVGELVEAALSRHSTCIAASVGEPISIRTVVPSLTFRPQVHPLTQLLRDVGVDVRDVMVAGSTATCHRIVQPDKFEVTRREVIRGGHVLLLDDVWTTGSNAQSAALALRRAGAKAVSVLVIGRWINPTYPPVRRFLERHQYTGFDPAGCPATGGKCP